MDDIHERLLTVAVEAVSIHGGKDQEEREAAIQHFKAGTRVGAGGWAKWGRGHEPWSTRLCSALRAVHVLCTVNAVAACAVAVCLVVPWVPDHDPGLCAGCAGGDGRGVQGARLPRHPARHQLRHAG